MYMKRTKIVLGSIVIVLAVTAISILRTSSIDPRNSQTESARENNQSDQNRETVVATPEEAGATGPITPTDYREVSETEAVTTEVVGGLDAPWAFVWLPTGDLLVTELFGTLQLVRDGVATAVSGVPPVLAVGQGGLLDVTVHPDFETNRSVYLSYAHGTNEANRLRVARAELRDTTLENLEVIFEVAETKSGGQHFGSRFTWLPDNTLLLSVGDGGNPPTTYNGELIREQAQNLNTYFGKVIRINDDGSIPSDNPFVGRPDVHPEIFSYGHRNMQGVAYDAARNRIVASEHGSKGGDEFNVIKPGANYGWPRVTYGTEYDAFSTQIGEGVSQPNFTDPLVAWTPTIAPSAVVSYAGTQYGATGDTFVAAMLLRSNTTIAAYASRPAGAIIRLLTDDVGSITGQELIRLGDVRVRSIAEGPDGYLYALTDTTDRQSRPGLSAGRIVRIESF